MMAPRVLGSTPDAPPTPTPSLPPCDPLWATAMLDGGDGATDTAGTAAVASPTAAQRSGASTALASAAVIAAHGLGALVLAWWLGGGAGGPRA